MTHSNHKLPSARLRSQMGSQVGCASQKGAIVSVALELHSWQFLLVMGVPYSSLELLFQRSTSGDTVCALPQGKNALGPWDSG